MKRYYYTPQQIHDYCSHLVQQIKTSEKEYDAIIPLLRGGLVPAQYIAYALDNREVLNLDVSNYENTILNLQKTMKKYVKKQLEDFFIKNEYKRVLFVDDLIDTGYTLKMIIEIMQKDFPNIKTDIAVIFDSCELEVRDDITIYSAQEKPGGWVVFPWDLI